MLEDTPEKKKTTVEWKLCFLSNSGSGLVFAF